MMSCATALEKPIELPQRSSKGREDKRKGTTVLACLEAPTTHMVAAATATADDTMYCECVLSTNASNCRVVKVLFDTGSSPYNFVREEIADWIEAEERGLPSDCYLSAEERRKSTTVNLAGSGAHQIASGRNVVFNLLFLMKLSNTLIYYHVL